MLSLEENCGTAEKKCPQSVEHVCSAISLTLKYIILSLLLLLLLLLLLGYWKSVTISYDAYVWHHMLQITGTYTTCFKVYRLCGSDWQGKL